MSADTGVQQGAAGPARGLNVLLVLDDDERWLKMYAAMARQTGYELVTTRDPEQFRQAYLETRPSVIALDLILGYSDCSEILDFLARCRCTTPVLLVSGLNPGFMDVMEKKLAGSGLNILGKIEKKRNAFRIEDILNERKIPSASELLGD